VRQRKEEKRIIKELKNNSNISISAAAASGRGRMSGLHRGGAKGSDKIYTFYMLWKENSLLVQRWNQSKQLES